MLTCRGWSKRMPSDVSNAASSPGIALAGDQPDVLIVGGGDSALEAATSIAEETGSQVTLSYRSDSFSRAKPKNREKVDLASETQGLTVMLGSNVKSITEHSVDIEHNGDVKTIRNDAIIVCAGGILPTPFLENIGISIETKHGTA